MLVRRLTAAALVRISLAALLAGVSSAASSWGDEGHKIVGAIAVHYLTPLAKQRIVSMLGADIDGLTAHTIVAETTWADKFRDSDRNTTNVRSNRTRNWHFVDIEITAPNLDAACFGHPVLPTGILASAGPASDCVVDKIDQFIADLKLATTPPDECLIALKFLLHFVGDIHQPLHASDDRDAGGNRKDVTAAGFSAGNLHHYWDTAFVESFGTDPFVVAERLTAKITNTQVTPWSKGRAADWGLESFWLAKAHAYGKLPAPNAQGQYRLSATYVADATTTVSAQLSKAGVRLAWILNDIFGKPLARCLRWSSLAAGTGA